MGSETRGNILPISGANLPADMASAARLRVVCFRLEASRYALPLTSVERVIPVVEFAPLPKAPEIVLGVMNLEGRILPVLNVRRRFGFAEREVELNDQLIVCRTSRRTVAILVDHAEGVHEFAEEEMSKAAQILPGLEYIRGVVKLPDGIVLIHDLDTFLSLDEEVLINRALAPTGT